MAQGCNGNEELLSALVDNELEPGARRSTAAHVLSCEQCSETAGKLLATKRLLDRSEWAAEVPPAFRAAWRRRLALDKVAQPARARRRWSPTAVRVVGIAAVGLLLIGGALYYSSRALPQASAVELLVSAHRTMVPGPLYPVGGLYCPVGVGGDVGQWLVLRRALLRVDGELVTHTVYQVGSCGVSVFEGPAGWRPVPGGRQSGTDLKGLQLLSGGGISLACWEYAGRRLVVVAQASPADVVELARQRQADMSRSPGL